MGVLSVALALVALILGIITIVQTKTVGLVGWAIVALALALLVPFLGHLN